MRKTDSEADAYRLAVERGDTRVTLILDVTAALISEVGIDRATIPEIARRVGISHKLLLRYFPNKRLIFTRLAQRHLERMKPTLVSFLADFNLETGFDGMIDASVAFSHWEPGYAQIWGGFQTVPGMKDLELANLRNNSELISQRARAVLPHLSEREALAIATMVSRTCNSILRLALEENEIADDLIEELKLMVKVYLRERLANE